MNYDQSPENIRNVGGGGYDASSNLQETLAIYNSALEDFNFHKEKLKYLGNLLITLSLKITELRHNAR